MLRTATAVEAPAKQDAVASSSATCFEHESIKLPKPSQRLSLWRALQIRCMGKVSHPQRIIEEEMTEEDGTMVEESISSRCRMSIQFRVASVMCCFLGGTVLGAVVPPFSGGSSPGAHGGTAASTQAPVRERLPMLPVPSYTLPESYSDCRDPFLSPPEEPYRSSCAAPAHPRFALVLHGMVSKKSGNSDNGAFAWDSDNDYPASYFVDASIVHAHYVKYLMVPSGGIDMWDTFIHTATPSREVRTQLEALYSPVNVSFIGRYHSDWKPQVSEIIGRFAGEPPLFEKTVSRWLSASFALDLVKQAEEARGQRYDKIYLTRPDILLWVNVDVRSYCSDAVYYTNCHAPYFPRRPCTSDFHYVMTSEMSRKFATIPEHLGRYRALPPAGLPELSIQNNDCMEQFVNEIVGAEFKTDHVVIARGEEVFRKTQDLMMEADYYRCHPHIGMTLEVARDDDDWDGDD